MIDITIQNWTNISENPSIAACKRLSPPAIRREEEIMSTFAHAGYPAQHLGAARFAAAISGAVAGVQSWLKRHAAQRRQDSEDAKLWRLALTDDRVMADLSRAMSAAAVIRNLKTYY
jgi:hypothetical protein